jgi:hypothetical protein
MLQRKVVRLGLAFPADERGLGVVLVHVVRYGAHVVEELRVHRPLLVARPKSLSDEFRARLRDRLAQRETLASNDAIRKSLVGRAVVVGRFGCRTKPTLVDAAAVEAEGVRVVGVQLDAQPRLQERARHPAWRESQEALRAREFSGHGRGDAVGSRREFVRRCGGCGCRRA